MTFLNVLFLTRLNNRQEISYYVV